MNSNYEQKAVSEISFASSEKVLRGVVVLGADGNRYALVANFDDSLVHASFLLPGLSEEKKLVLPGKTAVLLSKKLGWNEL